MERMPFLNKNSYQRLLIFPLIIALFILVIYKMQQTVQDVAISTDYEYASIQPKPEEQQNYDVLYYDLNLKVYLDSLIQKGLLRGTVRIVFKVEEYGTEKIILNLSQALVVDSVKGAKSFRQKKNFLQIDLEKKLEMGKIHSVTIYYHGWPRTYHKWIYGWKLAVHREAAQHQSPWIATMNPPYGAETWFPCKDDPGDKADSLRIVLEIPDTLQTVCNGVRVEERKIAPHRKRVVWKERYPIAPYLVAVNIGKFSVFRRMYHPSQGVPFPIELYCWPEDASNVNLIYQILFDIMDYYTTVLGPYPFQREKYAMVVHPGNGGMENQTVTSVDKFSPYKMELYAHELAHQWIGDMITNRSFHESAISEGLATFLTGLYLKHSQGMEAFQRFMKRNVTYKPGSIWVMRDAIPDSVYHPARVYQKGAWFFYMLYHELGEATFFKGLRSCLKQFAYGNVGFDDLLMVYQNITHRNLERFFKQWLYEKNVPRIMVKIRVNQAGQLLYHYQLTIFQKQKGGAYVLPLNIRFSGSKTDTLLTFEIFKKKHRFEFSLPFETNEIAINPDNTILLTWDVQWK